MRAQFHAEFGGKYDIEKKVTRTFFFVRDELSGWCKTPDEARAAICNWYRDVLVRRTAATMLGEL